MSSGLDLPPRAVPDPPWPLPQIPGEAPRDDEAVIRARLGSRMIAQTIVVLLRGVPASVRTVRNQTADRRNVWQVAGAGFIVTSLLR
jgi:hypothetical protein